MTCRISVLAAVVCFLLFAPVHASAAVPSLRGIAVEERLDTDLLPADLPANLPLIVRLAINPDEFTGPNADNAFRQLQDRLGVYQSRRVPVVLAIGAFPATDLAVEQWRQFIRAVAARGRGKVAAYQVGDVQADTQPDVDRFVYLLKLASVQIRSVDSGALIIQGKVPAAATDWLRRVFAGGTGPYVDGIAIAEQAQGDDPLSRMATERMVATIEREHPSTVVLLGPIHLPADADAATSRLIDAQIRALGTPVQVIVYAADSLPLKAAFGAAGRLTDLIAGDIVTLDERAADLRIAQAGLDVTAAVPHRLLYSLTRFDTFLVYWGVPSGSSIDVEISVANATSPTVRDAITGSTQKPTQTETSSQGKRLRLSSPATDHPMIIDFNFGTNDPYTETSDVKQEALPRVEEIIFQYQQVQAAQDAALQNYTANVRIEQHFHPSPADPAYNVVTENRLFSDPSGVEWEELSFELNGAKWTANRPAFPLVQPEKVLSLPLDLRLNQDYTYRLEGVDTVNERAAFVVRFDPVDATRSLYRGTVWIDRRTFVRLKIQAVETRLTGPVVSNDETQLFEPIGELEDRPVWLLSRLVSKQIFLIAGRNVLVEREVHLSDFSLNSREFDTRRDAARAGNRVMYRDTNAGVRYLVKKGETRVVSDQLTTSARALAIGTDIDPSFDYPLPLGGLDILDFNFLNRNMQLALLYGGVIALANIQHPNLWGGKFDASVDFFGLAVKSNDDVFDSQGKLSGQRVNKIPVSTGFNLGYQLSPFQKATGRYEFRYDAYFRDAGTAQNFVIPSSTVTNGAGAGYEYRRQGYSLTADAAAYQRTNWKPWGFGDGFHPQDRTYERYDVGLSKDFIFATFHTIHLNASYFGGQGLDRFSMYEFGLFDSTRMHGVPSAVRFADLGMFRGSYSFNLFDQYRLDLFADHASGRDPDVDNRWRQVTGTGVRLNLRAPGNTILQLDVGKSFLPNVYRGAGSNVVQILLLKPL
jgi:hypothetical protein